ncbi:hypothetical protein WKW80_05145 [Variovorax humicola]|uniref:Uncharacterized protein n=1 Tax=Variovorax humicola TaxID=1769758 RepID=A0ABU8VUH1_9BURK
MAANLLDPRRLEHSLTHDLHWARVVQIKGGGVMMKGTELLFKGSKSAAIQCVQTWWCIVDPRAGLAALGSHARQASLPDSIPTTIEG